MVIVSVDPELRTPTLRARNEHADVVRAVLVDPARAVEPQHLPGRGGGDHYIADVVDRGDETRQLNDLGAVATEDQDSPGADHNPGAVPKVSVASVML
jgi:hypothetical protein